MDPFSQFFKLADQLEAYAKQRFGERVAEAVTTALDEIYDTDAWSVLSEVQYAAEKNQSTDELEDMLDQYEGY